MKISAIAPTLWVVYIAVGFCMSYGQTPQGDVVLENAVMTSNFIFPLTPAMFFNRTERGESDPIKYTASKMHRPDLPPWLHYVHNHIERTGYLYGTPTKTSDAVDIQVIAVNKRTMNTADKKISLGILKKSEPAKYLLDLLVLNLNVEQLVAGRTLYDFLGRLQAVWPHGGDVYITKIAALPEAGIRLPVPELPDTPGQDPKDGPPSQKPGVLVQVGGTREFSRMLKAVARQISAPNCHPGGDGKPQVTIDSRFLPDFKIDWCRLQMLTPVQVAQMTQATPAPKPVSLSDDIMWPTLNIPRRDLSGEFVSTIIIPLILTVVLVIVMSYAMFGRREGVDKRNLETPNTQMLQFNTIRRATTNLRLMSHYRDGIALTPASTLARSDPKYTRTSTTDPDDLTMGNSINRDSTLSNNQAPPPYRLPPSYPTQDSGIISSDQQSPESSPSHNAENERLMMEDGLYMNRRNRNIPL